MDGLSSVLDTLAGGDLAGLGDGELLDRIAALVAARNRIEAELARTVRAADVRRAAEHDGLTTMRSWLRGHARLSAAEAGRVV
ncbi:endonuclease, partial [Geodermatophilus sp. CPCC 206100]